MCGITCSTGSGAPSRQQLLVLGYLCRVHVMPLWSLSPSRGAPLRERTRYNNDVRMWNVQHMGACIVRYYMVYRSIVLEDIIVWKYVVAVIVAT
jgi:hypothetical protein